VEVVVEVKILEKTYLKNFFNGCFIDNQIFSFRSFADEVMSGHRGTYE